jgi:hypothetical protein
MMRGTTFHKIHCAYLLPWRESPINVPVPDDETCVPHSGTNALERAGFAQNHPGFRL